MLVEDIPNIVTTIINTLLSRLPDLINGAVQLFMGIVKAIPQIITELVRQLPTIITTIVNSLGNGFSKVKEVGKNLIKGLWEGISDMASWIGEKIKGFGESVLGGIKKFFGIESPSRVMADVVGKNLALGIGEGFADEIDSVNDKITGSVDVIADGGVSPHINSTNAAAGVAAGKSININQVNNYSQAHSRYELWQSRKDIAAAVRLASV